jgi:hypothetical protein
MNARSRSKQVTKRLTLPSARWNLGHADRQHDTAVTRIARGSRRSDESPPPCGEAGSRDYSVYAV